MDQTEKRNSQKRILAVDDATVVLMRISNTLRDDYEVITANSGVQALKYLKENKVDLILLDIHMSPKDGIETLQELRTMKERQDIPVIMLTGVEDKDTILEAARLGICDYILKPFQSEELLGRICRVFGQKGQNSQQSLKREEIMKQFEGNT